MSSPSDNRSSTSEFFPLGTTVPASLVSSSSLMLGYSTTVFSSGGCRSGTTDALLRLARRFKGCCSSRLFTTLLRLTWILYRAFRLAASDSSPSSTASLTSA